MSIDAPQAQLREMQGRIDALLRAPYDHPEFTEWKLTVSTLLGAQFGAEDELVTKFRALPFRHEIRYASASYDGFLSKRLPTDDDHRSAFQADLERARAIIGAALAAWSVGIGSVLSKTAPAAVVNITNQNTNNAASSAVNETTVVVQFPLAEMLALVDQSALTSEQKLEAKEHLENLDGELRKASPRWEKIKPAVKFLLDSGKEVAIKVLGAVAAKFLTGA